MVATCRQFARALDAVISEDPQLRRAVRGALNPTHIEEAFAAIDLSELLTPEYAAGALRCAGFTSGPGRSRRGSACMHARGRAQRRKGLALPLTVTL